MDSNSIISVTAQTDLHFVAFPYAYLAADTVGAWSPADRVWCRALLCNSAVESWQAILAIGQSFRSDRKRIKGENIITPKTEKGIRRVLMPDYYADKIQGYSESLQFNENDRIFPFTNSYWHPYALYGKIPIEWPLVYNCLKTLEIMVSGQCYKRGEQNAKANPKVTYHCPDICHHFRYGSRSIRYRRGTYP